LIMVGDPEGKNRLIDLSRELDQPWEKFIDVIDESRKVPLLTGTREYYNLTTGVLTAIDFLVEALRTADYYKNSIPETEKGSTFGKAKIHGSGRNI